MKPHVRLYPLDIERLPWRRPAGAIDGVHERILAEDAECGSATRLLRVEPFVDTGVFRHDHWEEVLMLEGSYKMGCELHPTGTYTCKGPHVDHGPFLTNEGYLGLEVRDYHGTRMDKPRVTLLPLDIERLPWTPSPDAGPGVTERVLAHGASGSCTRYVRLEPGAEVPARPLPFRRETYVLSGAYKCGDEFHPAGTYTHLPVGSVEGALVAAGATVRLEIDTHD